MKPDKDFFNNKDYIANPVEINREIIIRFLVVFV